VAASTDSAPGPLLAPGTLLGERYVIDAAISTGSMGAVHRAHHRHTGEVVAVKRLIHAAHLTRFEIEARVLVQLQHERVVSVVDHFEDPLGYFLVMSYVDGEALDKIVRARGRPGLPVDEVLGYAEQACEALDYVHRQRVVHRDVKPANLIVGERGIVLVDFGVARELGGTSEGTVAVGTPRFMAPEVFSGGAASERSDVFGLAVTLTALITGEPPSYTERSPLRARFPEVPPEVEAALAAGREYMPERRISTIEALADALGRPIRAPHGASLALSVEAPDAPRSVIEAVVRTAAGVFDAAAASVALTDVVSGELVFQAAWGAGAQEIVGVRLPRGEGIAGSVAASGEPAVVPDVREDPRFANAVAARTGYIPNTMLVVPLRRDSRPVGVLQLIDRRDGGRYEPADLSRATLFAELAIAVL
jgi:eukaryotic-like serine/threonine-protein kinase